MYDVIRLTITTTQLMNGSTFPGTTFNVCLENMNTSFLT